MITITYKIYYESPTHRLIKRDLIKDAGTYKLVCHYHRIDESTAVLKIMTVWLKGDSVQLEYISNPLTQLRNLGIQIAE
jgi:hypothetical protein